MKKFAVIALCILTSAALCQGGGLKIGGHGSYSTGGDVNEEEVGYGAQLAGQVNDTVSIEISGTMFEDFEGAVEFADLAITLRLGLDVAEGIHLYGGGGGTYFITDFEEDAVVDPDDEIGYHFCGGVQFSLADKLELFGEYRRTFIEYEDTDGEYEFGLVRLGLNLVL